MSKNEISGSETPEFEATYIHNHDGEDTIVNEDLLIHSLRDLSKNSSYNDVGIPLHIMKWTPSEVGEANKQWDRFKHLPIDENRIKYAFSHSTKLNYEKLSSDQLWIIILYTMTDMEMCSLVHKLGNWHGVTSMIGCASLSTIWDAFRDTTPTAENKPWQTAHVDDIMGPYEDDVKTSIQTAIKILKLRCYLTLTGLPVEN